MISLMINIKAINKLNFVSGFILKQLVSYFQLTNEEFGTLEQK
jgi:hypothetical protein